MLSCERGSTAAPIRKKKRKEKKTAIPTTKINVSKQVPFVGHSARAYYHSLANRCADVCERLSTGSSVRVAGKWTGSRPGTAQQNELQAEEVQLLGAADPEVCSPRFSHGYIELTGRVLSPDVSITKKVPFARIPSDPPPPTAQDVSQYSGSATAVVDNPQPYDVFR